MGLKVVPGVYEDMHTFDVIEWDSYGDSPLTGLLFKMVQEGSDGFKRQTERHVAEWKEDPTVRYFKVIDTDINDEIVAFAQYHLYDEGHVHMISYPTAADVPQLFGESVNVESASDFFGNLWAGRERCIGRRPHILLQKLNTAPKHQRRGAGSMLVKIGCDISNKLGIIAGLEASPKGLPLYKKFGYQEQETISFDPRKYGRDAAILKSVCMVREPV